MLGLNKMVNNIKHMNKKQLQAEAVARDIKLDKARDYQEAQRDQQRDDMVQGEYGEQERKRVRNYNAKVINTITKKLYGI